MSMLWYHLELSQNPMGGVRFQIPKKDYKQAILRGGVAIAETAGPSPRSSHLYPWFPS